MKPEEFLKVSEPVMAAFREAAKNVKHDPNIEIWVSVAWRDIPKKPWWKFWK